MLITFFTLPTIAIYIGFACSLLACGLTAYNKIDLAIIFFILAGFFSSIDILFAKKLEKESLLKGTYELHVDTLVEIFSFGITPIVIGLKLGLNTYLDYVIFAVYLFAAILRNIFLNYVALSKHDEKVFKFYSGLPLAYSSLIFPSIFICRIIIDNINVYNIVLRVVYIIVAILFLLNIKIDKPRGLSYIMFYIIVIIAVVASFVLL